MAIVEALAGQLARQQAAGAGGSGGGRRQGQWRLTGLDPTYPTVDDFLGTTFSDAELTNVHSYTPLQGKQISSISSSLGQNSTMLCGF